jgi:hypothetical protein
MGYNKYNQTEAKSFPQIILGHYDKILELGRHELRPSERILLLNDSKQIVESEDTRLSYILAIENLGYALEPYFDKDMKEYFEGNIIFLAGFGFEILKSITEEEFKIKLKDSNDKTKSDLMISYQVRKAKEMFREIGKLMKRVDYLKSSVFGDSSTNETIEVEEDED